MKRVTKQLALAVAFLAGGLAAPDAAYAAKGVKYIHFDPATGYCNPAASECTPGQGIGESGRIYVHQREIDGQWVFDFMSVPGLPEGHLWMATNYGAKCKTGYRLSSGGITTGFWEGEGKSHELPYPEWTSAVSMNTDNMTYPDRVIDVHVPVNHAFGQFFAQNGAGHVNNVIGFGSVEDVYDYGEDEIADRVAQGQTEEDARKASFSVDTYIAMYANVWCEGTTFGRKFFMARAEWLPLEIVFVGVGQTAELGAASPEPVGAADDLTNGVAVTQAFLSVQPDHQNACRLRLSGVFTATEPTDVTYRFVDELGRPSQHFTTTIDQTQTVMIDHFYDLPEIRPSSHDIGDWAPLGRDDGLGGFQDLPTDRHQGNFQIEVLEPHGYWSNIDGYNVAPCYADLEVDGGFTAPLPPPPGGGHPIPPQNKTAG